MLRFLLKDDFPFMQLTDFIGGHYSQFDKQQFWCY